MSLLASRALPLRLCIACTAWTLGATSPPQASTACGVVQGRSITYGNGSSVDAFLGIKYATAGRWQLPVSTACTGYNASGVYDATVMRDVCVQDAPPVVIGHEDCLYLHVYTPPGASSSSAALPVMVYIHGGDLTIGSGNWEQVWPISGDASMVIVAINYRLNILGFLATDDLTVEGGGASGNYGIADQQMALQWVQNNIAAFGGNSSQIAIAGQSSGGTSVFALMSSPASRGLFTAGVALSGSPNISMSLAAVQSQNAGIPAALGCANGSTVQQRLACMRGVGVEALLQVIPPSWNTPGIFGLSPPPPPAGANYAALVCVDGVIIPAPFEVALTNGTVDVPLLFGSVRQEPDLTPDDDVQDYTLTQWHALLADRFAAWNASSVAALIDHYAPYANVSVQYAYDSMSADLGITCANVHVAGATSGSRRTSPTYLYVNAWTPSSPLPSPLTPAYNMSWAFHTLDWEWACNAEWIYGDWTPGGSDAALQQVMRDVLKSMASSGAPPADMGWQPASRQAGRVGVFVIADGTRPPHVQGGMTLDYMRDTCELWASIGFDSRWWWCN